MCYYGQIHAAQFGDIELDFARCVYDSERLLREIGCNLSGHQLLDAMSLQLSDWENAFNLPNLGQFMSHQNWFWDTFQKYSVPASPFRTHLSKCRSFFSSPDCLSGACLCLCLWCCSWHCYEFYKRAICVCPMIRSWDLFDVIKQYLRLFYNFSGSCSETQVYKMTIRLNIDYWSVAELFDEAPWWSCIG